MNCNCGHKLSHHVQEDMFCLDCKCQQYKREEEVYELN